MTVSELILVLSRQPPDVEVVVGGYEGGVTSVIGVEKIRMIRDGDKGVDFCGEHRPIWDDDDVEPEAIPALRIAGKRDGGQPPRIE